MAFADDDVLFDPRYLVEVREGLKRYSDRACFGCRVLPRWDGPRPTWLVTEGPYALSDAATNRVDMGEEDGDFPPGRVAGGSTRLSGGMRFPKSVCSGPTLVRGRGTITARIRNSFPV